MDRERLARDRATIRAELERRARDRQTITYGEAAALVARTARGLGKILDGIEAEERGRGRPDLGCLVVKVETGLPGNIAPGEDAKRRALAVREAVFVAWAAG